MNADPDPGGKMNADPCGSGSTALEGRGRIWFWEKKFMREGDEFDCGRK